MSSSSIDGQFADRAGLATPLQSPDTQLVRLSRSPASDDGIPSSDATSGPILTVGPILISPPIPLDAGEAALFFGGGSKPQLALLAALDQVLPEASAGCPSTPTSATLSNPSTPPPQSPEAPGVHRQGQGRQARSQREVLRDLSAYLQERLEVAEERVGDGCSSNGIRPSMKTATDVARGPPSSSTDVARHEQLPSARAVPASRGLKELMCAHSVFVAEVENSASWTIHAVGKGAAQLLQQSERGDPVGRSLAEWMRCEDVLRLESMWSGASGRPGTALPMHRVWLRCSPREPGRKRPYALVNAACDEDDWEHLLPVSCYRSFFFTLVALPSGPDQLASGGPAGSVGPHSRALLLGTCGPSQVLGSCSLCDMFTCACKPSCAVSIDRPPNTPDGLRIVSGLDLRVQNCWSERVKQDFGWTAVFNRSWHFGWKREQLASMYLSLPTEVKQVMGKLSSTWRELIEIKRSAVSKAILVQTFEQSVVGGEGGTDLMDLEAGCFEDGEVAAMTTTYNVTNSERQGFHMTRAMAHMLGYSYEEALVRLGDCQLDMSNWNVGDELEMLATHVDQLRMVISGHLSWTRYFRMLTARDCQPGVLVRAEFSTNLDSLGRCISTTWRFFPVSVEEFDRQLDTAAATVRPLMSVLGDRRRGQALLDDAKSDQEKRKVASLLQTQQGVQILKLLAKVIDEQLVSTVTASLCAARVQAQTVRAARSTFAEETNRSSRVNVWEGSGQLGSS